MLEKIEKILFYVFLFLIPFQIRIFLHNNGNEWNSAFLYLGDLVLMAVLGLWILRRGIKFDKKDILLLLFLGISAISLLVTSSLGISAFRFVKLLEFILLFIYVCKNASSLGAYKILQIIFYSGVFQAILAVVQFIKQGSIGIKFIEAGTFAPNLAGVANFVLNKENIMRSYGSFTHPNVLAGFLLLAIFAFYGLLLKNGIKIDLKPRNLFLVSCFLFLIFGLFLTFSRTAIIIFLAMSLLMFLIEFIKLRKLEHTEQRLDNGKKLINLFILVVVSCMVVIMVLFPYIKARFFTITFEEQAVDLRFFYNKIALSMIKDNPILGIGVGNFVNYSQNYQMFLRAAVKVSGVNSQTLPDWIFQPVHNIYLLIASEIGIFGLLVFLGFICLTLLRGIKEVFGPGFTSYLFFIVACFLIIALTDHYFLTLQSGGIMFWISLALIQKQ